MKIRLGFVSNSSSSSFVCDLCGEEVSGMDMCLLEAEMYKCVKGHTICESEILSDPEDMSLEDKKEFLLKQLNPKYYGEQIEKVESSVEEDDEFCEIWKDYGEVRHNLPAKCCPLCCFKGLSDLDALKYMMKELNTSMSKLLEEVKGKFSSYEDFDNFLRSEK